MKRYFYSPIQFSLFIKSENVLLLIYKCKLDVPNIQFGFLGCIVFYQLVNNISMAFSYESMTNYVGI